MGSANNGGNQPFSLPARHRANIPFPSATTDDGHTSNARHLQQTINRLPLDTSFLWLGGSVTPTAMTTGGIHPVHFDGDVFASEVFVVDPVNNLLTVTRAGWFEFNVGLHADTAGTIQASNLHIVNNTSGSPYPSPTMDFFTPDHSAGTRCGGVMHAPVGLNDTVQVNSVMVSGTANVSLENLFVRWVRPYYV